MLYDNESGVGVKRTAARSGAQNHGERRAEETAATVTGTSWKYATPIGMLGQPPLDGTAARQLTAAVHEDLTVAIDRQRALFRRFFLGTPS
jgi:hypothetical protein